MANYVRTTSIQSKLSVASFWTSPKILILLRSWRYVLGMPDHGFVYANFTLITGQVFVIGYIKLIFKNTVLISFHGNKKFLWNIGSFAIIFTGFWRTIPFYDIVLFYNHRRFIPSKQLSHYYEINFSDEIFLIDLCFSTSLLKEEVVISWVMFIYMNQS